MAMNAVTIAAIVAACWAHPQGQAYLAKIDQIEALSISCGNPCCQQFGAGQRKREEELWKNLPEFYQYKPKEEQKVEVLEKVFLPPTENVSPREIAEVLASAVKKIQSSSPLIVSEEDDEEALFMLMGWL